jgi:hypothetical protein
MCPQPHIRLHLLAQMGIGDGRHYPR